MILKSKGLIKLDKDNTQQNESIKFPLYVSAYEIILGWIKNGIYKPGEKLPAESILAEKLNISRGTLRQAILLLQEDGLIINHQGRGTFVLSSMDIQKTGLERLCNPLLSFATSPIEKVETSIQFQMASKKHQEIFDIDQSKLLAKIEMKYFSNGIIIGFSMIWMPYDILSQNGIDLENTEKVNEFYNEFIATKILNSDSSLRIVHARESTAANMQIEQDSLLQMMEEVLYGDFDKAMIVQKMYFHPDYYEFGIRRKNDRILSKIN